MEMGQIENYKYWCAPIGICAKSAGLRKMESLQSVAKAIVKPTNEARKEIMRIFRGLDERSRNTVFVSIWTGEIQSYAYYRSDKGEYLQNQPSDCYEFHVNRPKAFATYADVDAQIEEQYALAREAIAGELKILHSEIGREMQIWESSQEFNHSQTAMVERLAKPEGN